MKGSLIASIVLGFAASTGTCHAACHLGLDLDASLVSTYVGCKNKLTSIFALGGQVTFLQPLLPRFMPHVEFDLISTSKLNSWLYVGTHVGMGGYWEDKHLAGFTDLLVYLTGTTQYAPYASVLTLFFPTWLGVPNANQTTVVTRLGAKIKIPKLHSYLIGGAQLVFPDMGHNPRRIEPGPFVAFDLHL